MRKKQVEKLSVWLEGCFKSIMLTAFLFLASKQSCAFFITFSSDPTGTELCPCRGGVSAIEAIDLPPLQARYAETLPEAPDGNSNFGGVLLFDDFAHGTYPTCVRSTQVVIKYIFPDKEKFGFDSLIDPENKETKNAEPYEDPTHLEKSLVEELRTMISEPTGDPKLLFVFDVQRVGSPPYPFSRSFYTFLTSPLNCFRSCSECQNHNANACYSCKSQFMDWTAETDLLKKGRCLCEKGAVNAAGDGCDTTICHPSCASCKEAGPENCYTCADGSPGEGPRKWDGTLNSCPETLLPPGGGSASTDCHETCQTCSENSNDASDKCFTCKDLGAAGTLTLINGECRCQAGTYFVLGEARCAPCHEECYSCQGPESNQCSACSDKTKLVVPTVTGGVRGTCQEVYDQDGQVKDQFRERVVTPTVTSQKGAGVTLFSIENFLVGRQPGRAAPTYKRRIVPISLPTTNLLSRIEGFGSQFRYQELMIVTVEDNLKENTDYTLSGTLSKEKDSIDVSFDVKNKKIRFLTAKFTFINNNYFFTNIPNISPPSRRLLQDFSTTNQDLINTASLIANTTFRVILSVGDYSDWGVDWMSALGVILRIAIFLVVLGATVTMVVLIFTNNKTSKIVPIGRYLELVCSLSWLVKLAYIPALFSIYELVFLDELVKVDTLLMGEIAEEREIRSSLGIKNKFAEYSIPVLAFNSAAVMLGLLVASMVIILAAKVVSSVRNEKNRETAKAGEEQSKGIKNSKNRRKMGSGPSGKNNKNRDKGGRPFLELVWISVSLAIPTLFFYSTVGIWWNNMKGNHHWSVILFSLLSVVIFAGLVIGLVFGWGSYVFSLQSQISINTKKEEIRQKEEKEENEMELPNVSNKESKVKDLEDNRNVETEEKKIIETQEGGEGVNQERVNNQKTESRRDIFDLWSLWISLLRFSAIMIFIVTLQDRRAACLAWVIGFQVVSILGYIGLCLISGGILRISRLAFEGCATLLLTTIALTEVPSNRVEDHFGNIFLTILLSVLIYCCTATKITEFVMELLTLKKKNEEKGLVNEMEKDKKENQAVVKITQNYQQVPIDSQHTERVGGALRKD